MAKVDSGPQLVTQAEYARMRGVSKEAVRKAVLAGRISVIGDKKLLDPKVADIQWQQNSRARVTTKPQQAGQDAAGAPIAPPAGGDAIQPAESAPAADSAASRPGSLSAEPGYNEARTRRELAEAHKAELEAAKMSGRLVERDKVERAVRDMFQALRDRVMAVPRRTAPAVVGLAEVREIETKMTTDLRGAFAAFEEQALDTIRARTGVAG